MNRDKLELAFAFQESELSKLSKLAFDTLSQMQSRTGIDSPENLSSYDFAREIKADEFGGLEVSVFHYFTSGTEVPAFIKEAIGSLEMSVGESRMSRWFNIQPNGIINWPKFEHPDGED